MDACNNLFHNKLFFSIYCLIYSLISGTHVFNNIWRIYDWEWWNKLRVYYRDSYFKKGCLKNMYPCEKKDALKIRIPVNFRSNLAAKKWNVSRMKTVTTKRRTCITHKHELCNILMSNRLIFLISICWLKCFLISGTHVLYRIGRIQDG